MNDVLRSIMEFPTPFNFIIVIVLICSLASVISSIAKQIRKYGCHRQEIEFKRELVDRGLGAAEIERIVSVQGPASSDKPGAVHCQQ